MTWEELKGKAEINPILDVNGMKVSRLIWWLADFASENHEEVTVGDWVVEISHVIGMRKAQVGKLDAVGKLLKIEVEVLTEPYLLGEKKYTLLTLEGKEVIWKNAMFRKIDL